MSAMSTMTDASHLCSAMQETVLLSAESVKEESGAPSGVPQHPAAFWTAPHRLKLKLCALIMLLRNISAQRGLANGTRLIVKGIHSSVIDAGIATGNREDIGQRVFIPR